MAKSFFVAIAAICKISRGGKAIHFTATDGDYNGMEALLALGVDANQPNEEGDSPLSR